MKPEISVIMSVYNGMPYLKEAVKSILSQTYKNFEFIIVDDASDDSTPKYLKLLKDKRIKIITNKKNLGLAESLNKALKISKGNFIARMDADDISHPKRIETQVKFLTKNPEIDLCGTWANLINPKGEKIGEKKYPADPKSVNKAITWYTAVIHPTYMGKKSFFDNLHGYRENYNFAEDYDLLARAKNKFQITNIPVKLLSWRLQDARLSRTNMGNMDRVELRIKIESLKRDGFTLKGLLAVTKKLLMTYLIPYPLKYRIAKALKVA